MPLICGATAESSTRRGQDGCVIRRPRMGMSDGRIVWRPARVEIRFMIRMVNVNK